MQTLSGIRCIIAAITSPIRSGADVAIDQGGSVKIRKDVAASSFPAARAVVNSDSANTKMKKSDRPRDLRMSRSPHHEQARLHPNCKQAFEVAKKKPAANALRLIEKPNVLRETGG